MFSYDLIAHLTRAREFSWKTFGTPQQRDPKDPTRGVRAHLTKEMGEIAEKPSDLEEWIDVATLAFDGAMRAGYSPDEVAAMLDYKHRKNAARKWPDWRTAAPGQAIEHIRDSGDSR